MSGAPCQSPVMPKYMSPQYDQIATPMRMCPAIGTYG